MTFLILLATDGLVDAARMRQDERESLATGVN
jgi:hypothetical protein